MAESLITRIILKGETDPTLTKAFNNAKKSVQSNIQAFNKYKDVAVKATKIAAAGVAAGATASVKAAIDFESAFAGVQKTVDETDTTKYEDLSKGIRQMAKEMPTAATEIAEVAETAGQLGIKADDVLKFSKVMVQLGETTNLSSDVAADSIARLFNITGTNMDVVDRFGSTLVALGNNAASTEADIMNMASRIAASGNQIGLTEPQLLALATSLSSVGLEAEAGGTAISTIMSQIDKDVALNTEDLKTWASVAGMSASQFKQAWETDAYGAIEKIISGMADAKAGGENLNVLLDELGITNVRTSDTMKRLSSASELMSEMTVLANKSWEENTAMTKEAETRYATMASKLSVTKNLFTDLGITIGNHLMPYVEKLNDKLQEIDFDKVAEKITGAIDWVIEHFEELKMAAIVIASVFAGIKIIGFVKDVAALAGSIKTFVSVVSKTKVISNFTDKITSIGSTSRRASKQLESVPSGMDETATASARSAKQILASAVSFIALGAGIALASVGFYVLAQSAIQLANSGWQAIAVVGGLTVAMAGLALGASLIGTSLSAGSVGFLAFGASMVMVAGAIWIVSQAAPQLASAFTVACGAVIPLIQQLGDTLQQTFTSAGVLIQDVGTSISTVVNSIGSAISGVLNSLANIITSIGNAALNAGKGFNELAKGLKTITGLSLFDMGASLAAVATGIGAISAVSGGLATAGTGMQNLGQGLALISMYVVSATTGLNGLPSAIIMLASVTPLLATSLTQAGNSMIIFASSSMASTASLSIVSATFMMIASSSMSANGSLIALTASVMLVSASMTSMATTGTTSVNMIVNAFTNGMNKIPSIATQSMSKFNSALRSGFSQSVSIAQSMVNNITSTLRSGYNSAYSAGSYIGQGLANGMRSQLATVAYVASQLASKADEAIRAKARIASPSKVTTEDGEFIGQGVVEGIKNLIPKAEKMAKKFVTMPLNVISSKSQSITTDISNITSKKDVLGSVPVQNSNTQTVNITFAPVINGGNAEENRKMLQEEEEEFERKLDEYFEKKGRLSFNAV